MPTVQVVPRSTADARRATVVSCAITVFARTGFYATPIADVAAAARISPAYVFRLFDGKLALFLAAVDECFARVVRTLADGADACTADDPDLVLAAMGEAYAELVANRSLLMLQVHALSARDVPEIRQALHRGMEQVVTYASQRSGAADDAVQRFVAYGQLCHLIVATDLDQVPTRWAGVLRAGMTHPPAAQPRPADEEGRVVP